MIRIVRLETLAPTTLRLTFDDGVVKMLDVRPFISDNPLTAPLADPAYFAQPALYPRGRGVYWPNDYDMCPDWLRYHAPAIEESVVSA
mgnify:CR=1 FL=1